MIDEKKMDEITNWLKENVFRNPTLLFNDNIRGESDDDIDLIDVIASLHNLLYECVNGERYDYMFHWCNKEGSYCWDNIFDSMEDN